MRSGRGSFQEVLVGKFFLIDWPLIVDEDDDENDRGRVRSRWRMKGHDDRMIGWCCGEKNMLGR